MYVLDEGIQILILWPGQDFIENGFFFSIPSPKNPTWTHGSILKDIYEIPSYSIIVESPRITYIFVQKKYIHSAIFETSLFECIVEYESKFTLLQGKTLFHLLHRIF